MTALDRELKEASAKIVAPLKRERRKSAVLNDWMLSGSDAPLTKILPGRLAKVVAACCIIAREMGVEHPAINREIGEKNE